MHCDCDQLWEPFGPRSQQNNHCIAADTFIIIIIIVMTIIGLLTLFSFYSFHNNKSSGPPSPQGGTRGSGRGR